MENDPDRLEILDRRKPQVSPDQKVEGYLEAARLALLPFRLLTSRLRVLPDFIIIGCIKGGTTSLFNYVGRHPCVVRAIRKEVQWFSRRYERGLAWYRAHFPTAAYKKLLEALRGHSVMTGEASPSYLPDPAVAQRVAQVLPEVKLIVVLRNPADRAYSDFLMMQKYRLERRSFEQVMQEEIPRLAGGGTAEEAYLKRRAGEGRRSYLSLGIYADQLTPWKTLFREDQLLVLKSEDLFVAPEAVLNKVFPFLGLPNLPQGSYKAFNSNPSYKIPPAVRQVLTELYRPHNERLRDLLGYDMGW
jgi:hypothetical protein